MPVPKQKRAAARSKRQTAAWSKSILQHLNNYLQFVPCANCGMQKLSHRVCLTCAQQAKQAKKVKPVKEVKAEAPAAAETTATAETTAAKAEQAEAKAVVEKPFGAKAGRVKPKHEDLARIKDTGAHPQEQYQRKSLG
ncbi:MAG: hypothetical protein A2788_02600 [Candidatus Abawacabacteria bacterium RIFCSPHIGHO2_01_FULL_46_8]|uniref:Large ribosomal subunit protein bL32 n=1 Tax=Candidatus Abawacabacteria bacterium RIFCSPHIGHO2_01_FULL_46_8 TaxID=1817815 RepID=A0A1F4XM23_9BACT|nr:MAG: hypothetical protein A2788_02600 [Candidatus Abawacabacteria bacterium RIFCSPHIGHO2_01_FULL_46_8]